MAKFNLEDTADVIFFNKETGEEILRVESIEMSYISNSHSYYKEYSQFFSAISNNTVSLSDIFLNGESLARAYGYVNSPIIKRLIYLHNKTKSKRIKKKLNNRIIKEVYRYLN